MSRDVAEEDLFADTPSEEAYEISSRMLMYFFSKHRYIKLPRNMARQRYQNVFCFVTVFAFTHYRYHLKVLRDHLSYVTPERHELVVKIMFKFMYEEYFMSHARHIPFIMICALAMNTCRYLEDCELPQWYLKKTILLLARVFSGKKFLQETSFDSMDDFGFGSIHTIIYWLRIIRAEHWGRRSEITTEDNFLLSLNSATLECL